MQWSIDKKKRKAVETSLLQGFRALPSMSSRIKIARKECFQEVNDLQKRGLEDQSSIAYNLANLSHTTTSLLGHAITDFEIQLFGVDCSSLPTYHLLDR